MLNFPLQSHRQRGGRDFFRRRGVPIRSEFVNIFSRLDYGHAKDISEVIIQAYANAEVDAVYIVYNEFKSVIQQRVVVEAIAGFYGVR